MPGKKLTNAQIDGMKMVDLKAELKKLNLATGGKKVELVERLKDATKGTIYFSRLIWFVLVFGSFLNCLLFFNNCRI